MKDFGQTNAGARDWNERRRLSTDAVLPKNLNDDACNLDAMVALVCPYLKPTQQPGAREGIPAPSQASEPLGKQALTAVVPGAEADPVREAGLHGGSLAILREGRAL